MYRALGPEGPVLLLYTMGQGPIVCYLTGKGPGAPYLMLSALGRRPSAVLITLVWGYGPEAHSIALYLRARGP